MSFEARLDLVPELPGIYQLKNAKNEIIYIGKAINLKRRLSSYFQKQQQPSFRISLLIKKVRDFDFIVCQNELEALILESGLIKTYQPFYNVLLKDDKDYPYLELDFSPLKPTFKKVFRKSRDFSESKKYFGPYLAGDLERLKNAVESIFLLKTCGKFLGKENKTACLKYHIGACVGTCVGKVSQEDYLNRLEAAYQFLSGNNQKLLSRIKEEMLNLANKQAYQEAHELKIQYEALKILDDKQRIVAQAEFDADVIAIAYDENTALSCLQLLQIREGRIRGGLTYFYEEKMLEEVLLNFLQTEYIENTLTSDPNSVNNYQVWYKNQLSEIKQKFSKKRKLILSSKLPFLNTTFKEKLSIFSTFLDIEFVSRGKKKELLDMARVTAGEALARKLLLHTKASKREQQKKLALSALKDIFTLKSLPQRIEAYDISHLNDRGVVCSMTVFIEGEYQKDLYRQFNLTTSLLNNSGDDYTFMKEALKRRLAYLSIKSEKMENKKEDNLALKVKPDLILIDGGRSHVKLAQELAVDLGVELVIGGIVKNNKHQTRGLVDNKQKIWELLLAKKTNNRTMYSSLATPSQDALLSFLVEVQDKMHAKAQKGMKKRIKAETFTYRLEKIKGIGPQKRRTLLRLFGSIKGVAEASLHDILEKTQWSSTLCQAIYDFFHQENE